MKKYYLLLLSIAIISCTNRNADEARTGEAKDIKNSNGANYSMDLEKSEVKWRGTKPGGEHTGIVAITHGSAIVENKKLVGGEVEVDLNHIVNEDLPEGMKEKLVGHLQSEDFFHTAEFPTAVFEISSVNKNITDGASANNYLITGNLTMRGVSKSISFPANVNITDGKVEFSTDEFSIDRTLWGVNFKSKSVFAEFKDDFISDMINLRISAVFNK